MKMTKSFILRALVCLLAVLMLVPVISISAVSEKTDEIGYDTYTYWYNYTGKTRKAVYSKPMYEVSKVFTKSDLGCTEDSVIEDVHTAKNGLTYVLDGGASCVIILDENYEIRNRFNFVVDEEDNYYYFTKAKGIFVDNDGNIYIADTVYKRVIKCDDQGNLIRFYTLPDSHLIPSGFNYKPIKVTVDHNGYVYILSDGSYYGAILYSPEDEFLGFYGANDVAATISQALKTLWNKLFTNNAKRGGMVSSLPYTFTDLWVDDLGFVYTATGTTSQANQKAQIKRLNPGGSNILASETINFADEGLSSTQLSGSRYQDLMGVAVDSQGFIHAIDATYGRVFIYDDNCKMLSAFGGGVRSGEQDGTFRIPSAIGYNLNTEDIIVSDSFVNTLTIFKITDYGRLVKSAQAKTIVGDYEEAFDEWTDALELDRNCQFAYTGLARAYYVMGQNATDKATANEYFNKSMDLAKQGYDRETYSLAYGSVRAELVSKYFTLIMLVVVAIIGVAIFALVYSTKHKVRLIKNEKVHNAVSVLLHPFDSFANLKEKNLASVPICLAIIVLYYVFTVLKDTAGGFAFVYFDPSSYNALLILGKTAGIVILWTVANWGVCTLLGGKGKMKEIFSVISYSLIPLLFGSIIFVVASNLLVPDEATFLGVLTTICTIYSYLIIMIGSICVHDYSFGKFLWTTILTLFGCAIVIFLLIMVIVLMQQTWGFFVTLYSEILKLM